MQRVRHVRVICDAVAVACGAFCAIGFYSFFSSAGFSSLGITIFLLSLLLGTIAGIGFGLTQSAPSRRLLTGTIVVMGIFQLICIGMIYRRGLFDELAANLAFATMPTVLLLIIASADAFLRRKVTCVPIRLRDGIVRCAWILLGVFSLACLGVGAFNYWPGNLSLTFSQRLICVTNLGWYLGIVITAYGVVGTCTLPETDDNSVFKRVPNFFLKAALGGIVCKFVAMVAWNINESHPSNYVGAIAFCFVVIIVTVIVQYRFDVNIGNSEAARSV